MAEDKNQKQGGAQKAAKDQKVVAYSVRALKAGFRRAGRAWPVEAVEVAVEDLTKDQIASLRNEPKLVVTPVYAAE